MTARADLALLDNIVWHSLTGAHGHLSVGTDRIRRYAPGFSPLIGAKDVDEPDFMALAPFCRAGEQFYCAGWTGPAPAGWRIDVDTQMNQYVWNGGRVPRRSGVDAVRLAPQHADQAMALVGLTHPGPFAERTPELGEYFGVFDGDRLVAMSGERMHAGTLREISGVCTHPEYQGRGLARALMERIIGLQLSRGQTPFLHVMSANAPARRLYERMGFRQHQPLAVRVLTYVG